MQAFNFTRQIRVSVFFFTTILVSLTALGAMPEAEYKAALQFADKKVQKQKALTVGPNALSEKLIARTWLKELLGSPYKIGDHWDVAAWQINRSSARMTGDPTQLLPEISNFGIFHYEVVNVKSGDSPTVTLKITQTDTPQSRPVDSRITSLDLTMTDEFNQIEKSYFFKGHASGVRVSPEGIRSGMTTLELFPLDIPEITSADRKRAKAIPQLPEKIQSYANQIQLKPDLSKSAWFEQDDFFGRPIQVLWQQGQPWPIYMKTSYGIALLIHKGQQ